MDNCNQWVLAQAYISRHRLVWEHHHDGSYGIYDPQTAGWRGWSVMESYGVHGHGDTLYEAVVDYQEKTGKGWGSS